MPELRNGPKMTQKWPLAGPKGPAGAILGHFGAILGTFGHLRHILGPRTLHRTGPGGSGIGISGHISPYRRGGSGVGTFWLYVPIPEGGSSIGISGHISLQERGVGIGSYAAPLMLAKLGAPLLVPSFLT